MSKPEQELVEIECHYCKRKALAKRIPLMFKPVYDTDHKKWYSHRVCDYIWIYYCSACSKQHKEETETPFWLRRRHS